MNHDRSLGRDMVTIGIGRKFVPLLRVEADRRGVSIRHVLEDMVRQALGLPVGPREDVRPVAWTVVRRDPVVHYADPSGKVLCGRVAGPDSKGVDGPATCKACLRAAAK